MLASTVEITGGEGQQLVVDPIGPMVMTALYLLLLLLPLIIML